MKHIVALSGGKDSTAMALRLQEVEPDTDFIYVCTPTGDELPEMVEHFGRLREVLGKPIVPLNIHSLRKICRDEKMLPNFRARFCTRILKIEPFIRLMVAQSPAVAYVGLRADEEWREGAIYGGIEGITQRFPLREWGWGIRQVREYLHRRGISMPARTDCARCYHQRIGEWFELWESHPEIFADAVAQEQEHGHTFRTPGRDTWPTALVDLGDEFSRGRIPKDKQNLDMFDRVLKRGSSCRVCTL